MFSMCSELTPRARILHTRIPQFMQPCEEDGCGDVQRARDWPAPVSTYDVNDDDGGDLMPGSRA